MSLRLSLSSSDSISRSALDICSFIASLVVLSFDLLAMMVDTWWVLLNITSRGLGSVLDVVYLPIWTQSRIDCSEFKDYY